MSSIPPMNLFSGPQIQKTSSIYRPFGTQRQNYYQLPPKPLYPENYYSMPSYSESVYQRDYPEYVDRQQYIPINNSPFETLHKYERTNPTPRDAFITPYRPKQPTDEEIQERVPVIDLVLEQTKVRLGFQETGLPKGYVEGDHQRDLECRYNDEIHHQINYGYKLDETRSKKEIDQFYRSIKVTVDQRGKISVNNIREPEKQPKTLSTIYKTTEVTTTVKAASNLQTFDNNVYHQQQIMNPFQQSFQPFQQSQPILIPKPQIEEKAPSEKNSVVIPLPGGQDSNLQQSQLDQSKVLNSNE